MKIIDSLFSLSGRTLITFIVAVVIFQACSQSAAKKKPSQFTAQDTKLENTEEAHAKYARGFSISYYEDYKLIKVFNPFVDKSDTLRYVLIPRGSQPPNKYPGAQVIELPIRSIVVTGTTHVGYLEMLNATDIIVGIGAAKYVYNPQIRKKLNKGKIASLSMASLNVEKIIALDPDLVMIAAGSVASFNDYQLLMKMGIPVFVNADWLETTPLGRAEWVKVVAALLNKEALANKKFQKVAEHYNELKRLVAQNVQPGEKPLVINNLPYEGAWFVSGGESYMAQYLKDAGAAYPWYENNETGGLKLNFEAVYYWGLKADIWINPGSAASIQEILAKDSRFRDFKSIQTGQVYNNNKRLSPTGGNDYWETGVVRPDLILHDLINIFHPGLLQSDTMYFYQKLPRTRP